MQDDEIIVSKQLCTSRYSQVIKTHSLQTTVMDAITAMITFLVFMLLSSPPSIRAEAAEPPGRRVPLGTSISTGTWWPSQSGLFAFGFYPQIGDEFVVGIWLDGKKNGKQLVWTTNRDDPPVSSNAKLQFTMNGRLVLTDQGQEEKLIANANATASYASMLDSGNFVLYDSKSRIVWQSFDHPTDTLLGGQSLPSGSQLSSSLSKTNRSTGRFNLKMQNDGNLVMYPAYTTQSGWDAYWASGTNAIGTIEYHLYLNKTGVLQIRNSSSNSIIHTPSFDYDDTGNLNQTIYRATFDFDGVFRLHAYHVNNGSDTVIERWPDKSTCEVKGFCGFNSYCTFNDEQPVCNCLEGYRFIDAYKDTLGCQRNYSKGECRSGKEGSGAAFYNMVPMNNIVWEDYSYFKAEGMSSEDDCSSACLADCNCWAALYAGGSCKKQGLPLRYVRRIREDDDRSTIAFLKVGSNTIQNQGNKNDKPFPPQSPPIKIKTTSNKAVVHIIIVTTVFAMLLCSAIAISTHYMYKIRALRYKRLTETGNLGLNEEVALRRFSYGELKRATNHFKEELGKGSFGAVYKGALNKDRRLIAVKRLEKLVEEGEREFQAEVRAIGKTHHRNLVRLLGFCAEGSKRLLVYEYMSNGSLGNLLFGNQTQRRPDWDERVRIALDIARGILYLHEECEAPIIHCDIKPQNILMDAFWTAKISDFGLAKLLMPDQTRTFTMVRGTRGYLAPEWHKNTPISVKADVYSYGIVLLEILCCRRNFQVNNVSEPEEVLLSGSAYRCFVAGELNKLVPSEVVDRIVLENMIKVAFWCIQEEPSLRPTMKSVVLMIEGITDIAIPPCPNSNST